MIVEIGDHPVGGFRSWSLAVGDVVERACGLGQFGSKRGQGLARIAREFGGRPAGDGIQHPAVLELASDGSEPMTDRRSPISGGGILFGGGSVLARR